MLKLIAKRIIPAKHWLFLIWYRQYFGFFPALRAYFASLGNGEVFKAPNQYSGYPVFLRPGTTDQDVYSEIFHSKEYELDLGDPQYIVDAGAHIGISSVYFACKYPKATIISIEPEPSNFLILQMNVRSYPNIKPVNAGLWSRKAHLRVTDSNVETWAFQVTEDDSGFGIPAVGVQDIISEFNIPLVDVLKIDIEGSEVEVLSAHPLWMNSIRNLIIELHDRFRPGCTSALDESLMNYSYKRSKSGESVVIADIHKMTKSTID